MRTVLAFVAGAFTMLMVAGIAVRCAAPNGFTTWHLNGRLWKITIDQPTPVVPAPAPVLAQAAHVTVHDAAPPPPFVPIKMGDDPREDMERRKALSAHWLKQIGRDIARQQ